MVLSKVRAQVGRWLGRSPAPRSRYASRHLTVLPTDTFLVSYPKSGNTWLRFLVANLWWCDRKPVTFQNLEQFVPDIYRNTDAQLLALPQPRRLKSHESYTASYPRVIYVARDPRDVAISYYHHLIKVRKLPESTPIANWIETFLTGQSHPQFGTWADHATGWLSQQGKPDFCLVKYEDFIHQPQVPLAQVARFMGAPADESHLQRVIELSAADRMRQLEVASGWQPFDGDMRQDKRFVRAATSGHWQTELPTAIAVQIATQWAAPMQQLGYLP
ncbi:MAG: sulfotransferase domain-containing protein [Cyanobacteria bacterium P01_A01_bin.105]